MSNDQLPHQLASLAGFAVQRILSEGREGGVVALLGSFGDTPALVKLVRTPLPVDDLPALVGTLQLASRAPYSGAEYGYFTAQSQEHGQLAVDVVAPAAVLEGAPAAALLAKHVARSTAQPARLFRESAAAYAACHEPLVKGGPDTLGWVRNLLAGTKEVERRLLSVAGDDGFLLTVDPKWATHPPCEQDRATWLGHTCVRDLYALAICNAGLASLRDLRGRHLPMLRALRERSLKALREVYGVEAHSVKAFFHYPPQFYHLHVHFTAVELCVGSGCWVERAHLLDDVIDRLESDGEFYATAALSVRVGADDELWSRFSSFTNAA